MRTTSFREAICAFRASARIHTVAVPVAPAAGPTTLGTHAFIEMIMSTATKQLHDRHCGHEYWKDKVDQWHELARGGLGAGRQRTIAAGHAEVAGMVLVAELV